MERHENKRIYLYTGPGAAGLGLKTIPKILAHQDIDLVIAPQLPDDLADFDTMIFPGGGAYSMMKYLGEERSPLVHDAISNSGVGYVGICAGAYLATKATDCPRFPKGLGLLNVECYCSGHGKTIKGGTKLQLTDGKHKLVGYNQGPVFHHPTTSIDNNNNDIQDSSNANTDYEVVATFAGEMAKVPSFSTFGYPAIVRGKYGIGKVLLISPHPEQAQGLEAWTKQLIMSTCKE
jgi:glutamine amidotransferase-like uncharacterized protein